MNKLGIHRKCLKLVFVMITSNQIFDNRGCTDFWRVLKPEMEKMGTLKKNGDQKSHFGPHGDQSPQMGTNLGAVKVWSITFWLEQTRFFFIGQAVMGYQWLPHTSFLTCTKTRKLYFQKLYFQYHWFAAEFHCLAVGYTWLMCTKKFEGHIVPPNCSYSIIGPSLWIFSAAVGVARPQPLLPLEGVSRVSQAKANLMLQQACLVRDMG